MDKRLLLTVPIIFLLASTLLLTYQNNYATLIVYASGTPDAYGNRIVIMHVRMWNGTAYEILPDQYTWNGGTSFDGAGIMYGTNARAIEYGNGNLYWRVKDDNPLQIWVDVAINKTLTTTPSTATRVYLNITGVVTNQLMTYNGYSSTSHFYICTHVYTWNVTGQPNAGTLYSIVIRYEAYY
jgi:hypothetical protein